MAELDPILLAVCGFSLVCGGLILIGVFLAVRFTGNAFLLPVISALTGAMREDTPKYEPTQRTRNILSSNQLRNKAQVIDFDDALKRYQGQSPAPQPQSTPSDEPQTTPTLDDFDPSKFQLRGNRPPTMPPDRRLSRRNADEREDDLIGGLAGEDDDGLLF